MAVTWWSPIQCARRARCIFSVCVQLVCKGSNAFVYDELFCGKGRHFSSSSLSAQGEQSWRQAGPFPSYSPNSSNKFSGALPVRPLTELERQCQLILLRRDPSEPIEVSLTTAKFPVTPQNLPVILSRVRSPKDALRIVLYILKENPSYLPENSILEGLGRFWYHEKERFSGFISIFLDLRKPDFLMTPRRLTAVLRLYGWAGMVDDALNLICQCNELYQFQPDFYHFSCALHACIEEKRLNVALQVFRKMDEEGHPPTFDSFTCLIAALMAENKLEEAGSLLILMIARNVLTSGELSPKIISYPTVLNAFLSQGDLERARIFLLNLAELGYKPDYISCSVALKEFSHRGQATTLDQFYDELRTRDLVPDPNLLRKFLNGNFGSSLNLESLEILNSMANTLDSVVCYREDNASNANAHSVANVEKESSCCDPENEHMKNGEGITGDDMPLEDFYFVIFDQLIYSFSMLENSDSGYELFIRMLECSKGTKFPVAVTNMLLFDGLVWKCEWEKAQTVLRLMVGWGHMPIVRVFNHWVQGSCKAGRVDMVYKFLDEHNVQELVLDATSYNVVLDKLCMEGKLEEARKVTLEVKRNIGTPDVVSYSKMIQSFAKVGDFEIPRKLLTEMVDNGITPFALPFAPLVNILCSANKTKEALAFLDELEGKGCKPASSLYTPIVRACCESGDLEGAFQVMDSMKAKGVTPEPQASKLLVGGCIASQKSKGGVRAQTLS